MTRQMMMMKPSTMLGLSLKRTGFLRQAALRCMATVGDKLPSVELQAGWPPQKYNLAEFAANKKIIVMGLPGACKYMIH